MIKTLRITVLYILFFFVALIAGAPVWTNMGMYAAFTFLAPVAAVWWSEKRRSEKRNDKERAIESKNMSEGIRRDKINLNKAIDQYAPALRRNFRRAVTRNDLGYFQQQSSPGLGA